MNGLICLLKERSTFYNTKSLSDNGSICIGIGLSQREVSSLEIGSRVKSSDPINEIDSFNNLSTYTIIII